MESRLGMPSRTLLLKRGRMVGRRNRSRVRGIDQSLANASQLGKREPSWFELWLSCCSMIPRSPRSKRTSSPSNLRAIRCYEKAGFERQGTVTTPDGPAVYMVQTRQASSEHAVLPNPFHRGGRPRAGALGRPSCQTLNIMRKRDRRSIDSTIRGSWRHRAPSRTTLLAAHLYGSAVDGGLKPHSDIDLLVTVTVRLDETTRRALINDLWKLRLPWRERDSPRCRSHHCCARRHHSVALSS